MSWGMDATTGLAITEEEHLRQSINQIFLTPTGSRVERRPFGSLLPDLIDYPLNDYTTLLLYAASATALIMWEPRLQLTRITLNTDPDRLGGADLFVEGISHINGRRNNIEVAVPVKPGFQS